MSQVRRFTFRLSTLFVVVTVAAIGCAFPRMQREVRWWRLKQFVNQDLRNDLDRSIAFNKLAEKVLPPIHRRQGNLGSSSYFWQLRTDQGECFLLFQEDLLISIPGNANVYVTLFDKEGRRVLSDTTIPLGSRVFPAGALLDHQSIPGETLLVVKSVGMFSGGRIDQHFFSFRKHSPVPIRMEKLGARIAAEVSADSD